MKISCGLPYPFGATLTPDGVNFAVVSKPAETVVLCLFDSAEGPLKKSITLDPAIHKTGHTWHIHLSDVSLPLVYSWKVRGPFARKYRFDFERFLLDPYAKATASPTEWGSKNKIEDWKGVVLPPDDFDWEGDQPLKKPLDEMIIYEMHIRCFTQHPSSQVSSPGTYRGLIEKIPYLTDLGITAVELMPVYEFDEHKNPFLNPETKEPLLNTWGYSPLSFFAPMRRFASSSELGSEITEFKEMVKELHRAGIEVILDVVYNHTGEGGYTEKPISFRGFDNSMYYMQDANSHSIDFTGCGNTLYGNHPTVKEFMIDSLRYWVTEMHVDGFRFDLASVLNRGRYGRPLATSPLVDAISQDPILGKTKLIAEPWDAGGMYQVGSFYPQEDRWSEWNGKYRDGMRRFINGHGASKGEFAGYISGSSHLYGHGRSPTSSINFITCHDGFCLRDLVSYNQKHNELNGEDNRDGTNDNYSNNYGEEGPSQNAEIEKIRQRQIRNFFVTLFVSQGIPMIYMGDEYGHTKLGNNNSYPQDNEISWFNWEKLQKEKGLQRFVKGLISLRKNNPCLRHPKFLTDKEIAWHSSQVLFVDWESPDPILAFTLFDLETQRHLYIAYNLRQEATDIDLPDPPEGALWHLLIDTSLAPESDYTEEASASPYKSLTYKIQSLSVIVMKALPISHG